MFDDTCLLRMFVLVQVGTERDALAHRAGCQAPQLGGPDTLRQRDGGEVSTLFILVLCTHWYSVHSGTWSPVSPQMNYLLMKNVYFLCGV